MYPASEVKDILICCSLDVELWGILWKRNVYRYFQP